MKTLFLLVVSLLTTLQLGAQHPLVGTWKMISLKGISAEGEKFSMDTTSIRETKIITPTHYMLIAEDVQGDSLVFNRSYAGEVKFNGSQYIEIPLQASVQIFENVKTDFTWKVEGDKFTQAGTIIRPDGKKIILEELIFLRVKTSHHYPKNPAIGAWSQLTSAYVDFAGKKGSHSKDIAPRFEIITPTHWMLMAHRDKKFQYACGGSYTMKDDKSYPLIQFGSLPREGKIEQSQHIANGQLHINGTMSLPDGKKLSWEDVYEPLK